MASLALRALCALGALALQISMLLKISPTKRLKMGVKLQAVWNFDAFRRAVEHLLQKTKSGAVVIGLTIMATLFVHELKYYLTTYTVHQDKGFEDAKVVIEALKNKGISNIGAAGICWGAKVVAELAKADYINAAVMLHPSLVTVDDIREVKCHIAVLGAEVDKISPPELVKQFEEILSAKNEVNSYVKIFPGVAHGWTVRYDVNDETAVKKAEEAHQDMLEWFVKYLK